MRILTFTAKITASVEENLRLEGFSSVIITGLRKELGLIKRENGENIRTIDKLVVGEKYVITLIDEIKRDIPPYDFPIDIVYEDDDVAVINKPYSLAVLSTNLHYAKSLENVLKTKWGNFVYRPVTRLDKDTSGLMIVAKNSLSHSLLATQNVTKKYVALVEGKMDGEGTINAPIYKPESGSMKRIVDERGKQAITLYKSLKVYDEYSLVEFTLKTGRTHQIRVHSAYIGHPLCCDFLYNPNPKEIITPNGKTLIRQALHSKYLNFTHPITKLVMEFSVKADFEK